MKFTEPVALVTGGTRGIGLGIARSLASEGIHLLLNGRKPAREVAPVIEELAETGVEVRYQSADLGTPKGRTRLLDAAHQFFGRLDFLINNAGIAPAKRMDLLEADLESFRDLMRVNLEGPYFLTQIVARWMLDQRRAEPRRRPAIVFISSVSARVASPERGDYCMSKAALSMARQLFAVRLAADGIPVFEIQPGIIQTDMTAGVKEKYNRLIGDGILLEPRWGEPEDVGKAVAALLRGDLPYATGQVLTLDGGLTLLRL
ncbi:MAG: 3-ketoacyl-ACP reductase [Planctomycetota bacterium]|nr:MAG: 3-ketoacyl-ACP reductase [Planctomycetota bacterium]